MREGLDQWDYVVAAYAIGLMALTLLVAWAWTAMRRAEARRDATRRR